MQANPHWLMRKIVEKFDLDWALEKDYKNGIGLVCFYSDASMRHKVFECQFAINEWFR